MTFYMAALYFGRFIPHIRHSHEPQTAKVQLVYLHSSHQTRLQYVIFEKFEVLFHNFSVAIFHCLCRFYHSMAFAIKIVIANVLRRHDHL